MSDIKYKIVLTGYYHVDMTGYKTQKGEYYIEKDFADAFHIPREKARELFQSVPTVLKENLSYDEAQQYRKKIEAAGGSCEIQDMDSRPAELSLAPE
ncbi:MAG: ribosomal protein L7/L12 [Gammaproteobacteria bacterium]|nr:ribosomal protein L7/L12 [Gammaproteobacteria bacterium]